MPHKELDLAGLTLIHREPLLTFSNVYGVVFPLYWVMVFVFPEGFDDWLNRVGSVLFAVMFVNDVLVITLFRSTTVFESGGMQVRSWFRWRFYAWEDVYEIRPGGRGFSKYRGTFRSRVGHGFQRSLAGVREGAAVELARRLGLQSDAFGLVYRQEEPVCSVSS